MTTPINPNDPTPFSSSQTGFTAPQPPPFSASAKDPLQPWLTFLGPGATREDAMKAMQAQCKMISVQIQHELAQWKKAMRKAKEAINGQ